MLDPFSPSTPGSPPPVPLSAAVPPAMPTVPAPTGMLVREDDKTMGMLCHLLAIFTGFLGPLILWLVKKDSCPFVGHHGREALNFQITVFLAFIGLLGAVMGLTVLFIALGLPPFPMILIPLIFVFQILVIVAEVMAAVAAQRGDWHRYPFCLRLV